MSGLSRCGKRRQIPMRDPAIVAELGLRVAMALMSRADWRHALRISMEQAVREIKL